MKKISLVLAIAFGAVFFGLLGCKLASNGPNTNVGDPKLTDTKARDAADIKTLEERFTAAFRAKDVSAISVRQRHCLREGVFPVFAIGSPAFNMHSKP